MRPVDPCPSVLGGYTCITVSVPELHRQSNRGGGRTGHKERSRRLSAAEEQLAAVRRELSAAQQQLSAFEAASAGAALISL